MGGKKKSKKALQEGNTSTDTLTPDPTALTVVVEAGGNQVTIADAQQTKNSEVRSALKSSKC